MIKPYVIKELYSKHSSKKQHDSKDLEILKSKKITHHSINISEEYVTFTNLKKDSPLYRLPLKNVIGIEDLDNHIAIVLKNSIIFLSKPSSDINVHIRFDE